MTRPSPHPHALATAAVIAGAASIHGAWIVRSFAFPSENHGLAIGALTTGALTFVLVLAILRARGLSTAVPVTVFGSVLAGALNGASALALNVWLDGGVSLRDVGVLLFGSVLAAVFGAAISLAFAVAMVLPVLFAWDLVGRPSRGNAMTLATVLGGWLAVALGPLAVWCGDAYYAPVPLVSTGVGGLSAIVAVAAAARLAWRAVWLRRVRAGRVPSYAIVAASEVVVPSDLEAWSARSTRDEVLVRDRSAPDAVYRGAISREAIAYVGQGS